MSRKQPFVLPACGKILFLGMLAVGSLAGAVTCAQQSAAGGLPDAPLERASPQTASGSQTAAAPGTLIGTVTDKDGALIAGAHVQVIASGQTRTLDSGSDGRFFLDDLPAGDFQLSVTSNGQLPAKRQGKIRAGNSVDLGEIALLPAGARADVQVNATQEELAEAEMRAEETQRVIGFIPNFYVTYDWHAAPLNSRQKYHLAFRTIVDPVTLLLNGVSAGIEQAQNTFPGFGQGAAGYGKRYAANYGDVITGTLLGGAVFPQIFHQDPRYFYKGTGSIKRRLGYALATTVICRGDNEKWQPCYSAILGDLGSGAISNAYYPAANRNGVALTFEQGLLSVGLDGVGNVIQEFVIRHLTPHPPTYPSTTP